MTKLLLRLILFFALLGIFDAGFLTFEHFQNTLPPCSTQIQLVDCGAVLRSKYAVIYGVPVALFGLIYYLGVFILSSLALFKGDKFWRYLLVILTITGVLASAYFMYLQLFVLHSICLYCTTSAVNSLPLFLLSLFALV